MTPSPEDIDRLVKTCNNCRRSFAESLLKKCDNDYDKALALYTSLGISVRGIGARRGPNAPSNSPTGNATLEPTPPPTAGGTSGLRSPGSAFDDVGDDSSRDTYWPTDFECYMSCLQYEPVDSPDQNSNKDEDQDQDQQPKEWDFLLPCVPAPDILINGGADGSGKFSLPELVGAIQNGETTARVTNYLAYYDTEGKGLPFLLNESVEGFPAFFYVVQTRAPEMIRVWAKYGGDVNARAGPNQVPLLAYAIAIGGSYAGDTRVAVATLLSLGAAVSCIPAAFYKPLARDLPDSGPPEAELDDLDDDEKRWATPFARQKITTPLNFCFTTRSHLHLAALLRTRSGAERQVAKLNKAENLLGIPFFLIGQVPAATFLIDRLLASLAMPIRKPTVFIFAGPSGHGKTEIAKRLGELVSLDFLMVDCTTIKYETDLFGPRPPYQGHKDGSPLNNYIAAHNGQKCVVFLDEFEKTEQSVRQTLLIPFQSGEYQDRRSLATVDCSKTIWILATNAFDDTIHDFCSKNQTVLFDPERLKEAEKLVQGLSKEIRSECVDHFGAPVTGRITAFLPFLTFSPCEQAVVVDKYLAEFGCEANRPLSLANAEHVETSLVGNVEVRIRRGFGVCSALAQLGYVEELGARSVINEVEHQVRFPLVGHYLRGLDEVREGQERKTYLVDVNQDGDIEFSNVPTVA